MSNNRSPLFSDNDRRQPPDAQEKDGRTSSFWPGLTVMSFPADQTLSLINSLNVSGSFTLPDHLHVLPSTHTIGVPCSQFKPPPWPRKKRALPNPTSCLTSMTVTAAVAADVADAAGFGLAGAALAGIVGEVSALVLTFGTETALAAFFLIFIFKEELNNRRLHTVGLNIAQNCEVSKQKLRFQL